MFGLLADQGVGSIPWSPLAQGVLTRPWGDRRHQPGQEGAWTASAVPCGWTATRPSSSQSSGSPKRAGCRWRRSRWHGC